jgi:protein-tyrosine phosphatase
VVQLLQCEEGTVEESLACVRRLQGHGFVGTVCTPHFCLDIFPHNVPAEIARRVGELEERLRQEGIDYQLWTGGEVRIDDDTISWFETAGVPTLGPGRHVLIDYWGDRWPQCGDRIIDYLFQHDYLPILAHPERMNFRQNEWESLLADLAERGVWLQGNLNSLSGGEGRRAQEWSWQLLSRDSYFLIATDMHRPVQLDGRMEGLRRLHEQIGESTMNTLLQQRPREILAKRPDLQNTELI